jgi:hypothetical protein
VSAWAGLFYFASRVRAPGEDSAPLVTWSEGNGRLVAHLAGVLGARVQPGWTVVDVDPGEAAVRVIALDRDGAPVAWEAERVVLAVPQFVAARLLRPWRERGAPAHVAAFSYGAWVVVNLALRDRPRGRGFPLAWDNVVRDSDALGYVIATHQEGRDHGPTVLTWYRPLLDDDPKRARQRLYDGDRVHWARVALEDLARVHPELPGLCTRADVARWGHAMVRPSPGLISGGALAAARRPFGAVHFAHTELSGVALFEEALDHGVRAGEEVLAGIAVAAPSWRGWAT